MDGSRTRNIEIGDRPVKLQVVPGQAADRVGKRVAHQGRGTRVDALAPREGTLDIQTPVEPPENPYHHRVISGVTRPEQAADLAVIGVYHRSAACRRRP